MTATPRPVRSAVGAAPGASGACGSFGSSPRTTRTASSYAAASSPGIDPRPRMVAPAPILPPREQRRGSPAPEPPEPGQASYLANDDPPRREPRTPWHRRSSTLHPPAHHRDDDDHHRRPGRRRSPTRRRPSSRPPTTPPRRALMPARRPSLRSASRPPRWRDPPSPQQSQLPSAATWLGVSGTLMGAAIASIVGTVGSAMYTYSLQQGSNVVRRPGAGPA